MARKSRKHKKVRKTTRRKGRKSGRHGTPKPRLAVIGGAIGSGLVLVSGGSGAVTTDPAQIAANVKTATSSWANALPVLAPVVGGTVISVLASKAGLNKALARAKAPFRI